MLVSYASDYQGGDIIDHASALNYTDDANFVKLAARKQDTIRLNKGAHPLEEQQRVWNETYGQAMHDGRILSDEPVDGAEARRPVIVRM